MQQWICVQSVDCADRVLVVPKRYDTLQDLRVPRLISCGMSAPHCSSSGRKAFASQKAVKRSSSSLVARGSLVKKLRMRRASGTWKNAMGSMEEEM